MKSMAYFVGPPHSLASYLMNLYTSMQAVVWKICIDLWSHTRHWTSCNPVASNGVESIGMDGECVDCIGRCYQPGI